jgi:hypothetical protein
MMDTHTLEEDDMRLKAMKIIDRYTDMPVTADEAAKIHKKGDWYTSADSERIPLRLHICENMRNHFEYEPRWLGRE